MWVDSVVCQCQGFNTESDDGYCSSFCSWYFVVVREESGRVNRWMWAGIVRGGSDEKFNGDERMVGWKDWQILE